MTWYEVKSSNIVKARYNTDGTCDVQFKNGTYRYHGLSPKVWEEWKKDFQTKESSGKFFHRNIKPLKFEKK